MNPPGKTASFAQPFDMLQACHERLQRLLATLARMRGHVALHGADEQARQAARDVMRYFDQAAPQHHRDEELHVFPRLLAQGDAAQRALVERLQQDHHAMHAGWERARPVLAALAEGELQRLDPRQEAALVDFASLHASHLEAEEAIAYPATRPCFDDAALAAMGREMGERRGVRIPQAGEGATPSSGG
ncbi:MAG TPA: hemerythrin domain-containing protein [Ramlibacter sp.]|jgi:hemerythrin-like domain-containing protein